MNDDPLIREAALFVDPLRSRCNPAASLNFWISLNELTRFPLVHDFDRWS